MRKLKQGRKLSRKSDQRKALLKALATALILRERIRTTEAKAKEVQRFVEKCVTRARSGSISSKRLLAKIFSPEILKKLVNEISPRYKERQGGYTRVIKLGPRIRGEAARMAFIEFIK